MDITREETAIHEAGHCVAAMLLMQWPGEASIVPDDNTTGRVYGLTESLHFVRIWAGRGETDIAQRLADRQAFICAAGQIAVWAILDHNLTRHGVDDAVAMEALEIAYGEHEAIYCYDEILSETARVFADTDVIAAVRLVASALVTRLVLEDDDGIWRQVHKLLRRSQRQTFADLVKLFKKRERARVRKSAVRQLVDSTAGA